MIDDYIDLTDPSCDLSSYEISEVPGRNCMIIDMSGNIYSGFLLAKSRSGKAYTICDLDFHYSENDKKYGVRPTFRRTFNNLQDKPVQSGQLFQRISFQTGNDGYREFWKMIAFLSIFKNILDTSSLLREYRLVSSEDIVFSLKQVPKGNRAKYLLKIIEESCSDELAIADLLSLKARRHSVEIFSQLLKGGAYKDKYRKLNAIKKPGDEAIWHHFFKNNQWIFGLSIDLRFTNDYLDEQSVGLGTTINNGGPVVDFMGISDFTTLVEIKTPDKKFLKESRNAGGSRANTWAFHEDFIDAVSQCLGQKDEFLKSVSFKTIIDESNNIIDKEDTRTVDPKTILIYGHKSKEFSSEDSSDIDSGIKRNTLERFIRDSRNITIISFDELYKRACAIIDNVR